MKKIIILLFTLALASCEWVEKVDKQMDADSTDIANEIADMKGNVGAIEKLANEGGAVLFKAVGSEPGWYAECSENKFRMLMNYGKDSIVIFQKFPVNGGFNFAYHIDENGNKVDLSFKVEDKECTDASGRKNPNFVTVSVNSNTFQGCGIPVK